MAHDVAVTILDLAKELHRADLQKEDEQSTACLLRTQMRMQIYIWERIKGLGAHSYYSATTYHVDYGHDGRGIMQLANKGCHPFCVDLVTGKDMLVTMLMNQVADSRRGKQYTIMTLKVRLLPSTKPRRFSSKPLVERDMMPEHKDALDPVELAEVVRLTLEHSLVMRPVV